MMKSEKKKTSFIWADPKPQWIGLGLLRSFSSSSPIKPVSYPAKSEDSSAPEEEEPKTPPRPLQTRQRDGLRADFRPQESGPEPQADAGSRPWTREDARFVKDIPVISPVSYPSRVAPLPEDRASAPAEEGAEEDKKGEDEQLRREARRIESGARARSFFGIQEEEKIPFPTLIKPEKRPQKVPMDLMEAIRGVQANAKRNFVETVEAHVNLGVDPRRGLLLHRAAFHNIDMVLQMVRGALTLPHGTGKTVRVAVFAEGPAADEARAAGADVVGGDELIEEIKNGGGKLNFDKCIATPMFMPRLSKIARILGPRGLMPNPKLGSVTSDVSGVVKEAKRGRIDFKIDKTAIVHAGLGKVNFSEEALCENIGAFVYALLLAKPVGLKRKASILCGSQNSEQRALLQLLNRIIMIIITDNLMKIVHFAITI
ncbi:50S ribosomal protein L1 [Cocos nucifera]|uniref:CL1 n=1 Tax=Cocos nucifera TaxID=13894 RepID=A0A8K0HXT1_COCNU|nr:50S ribosomal protein L1 [Cocos nucifera]